MTIAKRYRKITKMKVEEAWKLLWEQPGSPCIECVVRASCKKDPADNSACDEYTKFIIELVKREKNEDKD